jgi:hypothetical protein
MALQSRSMPDPPPAVPDYARPAPPRRVSNLGRLALIAALLYHIPILVYDWLPRLGVTLPQGVETRLSHFIFDFGIWVDAFLVLLCLGGLTQRGGRRDAVLAFGVVVTGVLLLLLS